MSEIVLTPGRRPSPWGEPTATGCLKRTPEDFIVEEVLGFEPLAEAGEHLWLQVRKRGLNTDLVARELAGVLGVRPDAVSYSGLKDRHAVTTQWFSVHLQGAGQGQVIWPLAEAVQVVETVAGAGEYQVLQSLRVARKLRRGTHAANRFVITLRDVQGDRDDLGQRLACLRDEGVPNYFGLQRFGRDGRNLAQGLALIADRRAGRRRRRDNRESLWLSSLRSALFNQVLGLRVEQGSWNRCLPGDVLQLDGRGSFFTPDADVDDWSVRLQAGLIHPTGPLPGEGQAVVSDAVATLEAEVLSPWQPIIDDLAALRVPAQRRALRLRVEDLAWSWPEADVLRLDFRLTAGSFATSVIEQLVRTEGAGEEGTESA